MNILLSSLNEKLRSRTLVPSPKLEAHDGKEEDERTLVDVELARSPGLMISIGRGGRGNHFHPSKTPSSSTPAVPTQQPKKLSTGRGGRGNILAVSSTSPSSLDEEEARHIAAYQERLAQTRTVRSSGRGGRGNMTATMPREASTNEKGLKK